MFTATKIDSESLIGFVSGTKIYDNWNESTRPNTSTLSLSLYSISRRDINKKRIQLLKPGSVLTTANGKTFNKVFLVPIPAFPLSIAKYDTTEYIYRIYSPKNVSTDFITAPYPVQTLVTKSIPPNSETCISASPEYNVA